jgi:hypothetical protein
MTDGYGFGEEMEANSSLNMYALRIGSQPLTCTTCFVSCISL